MSPILGGRTEVFLCPVHEVLGHMLLANQEDEAKRFDQFVLMLHANPMTDGQARERYAKMIEPHVVRVEKIGEMKTDLNQLQRMKDEQMRGV